MPYTSPILFDDVLQLSISKLKEWGYLETSTIKSGKVTWSRQGCQIGAISIAVNTEGFQEEVELSYNYGNEPRKYKVRLVAIPSNLSKGVVWYFQCPKTFMRCRKLYSIGGWFFHRKAFKGCMYETQTQSKKTRQLLKFFEASFREDEYYEQLNQKNFKRTYSGKPTKKFLRIMEQIQKAESIPYREIERAMLS